MRPFCSKNGPSSLQLTKNLYVPFSPVSLGDGLTYIEAPPSGVLLTSVLSCIWEAGPETQQVHRAFHCLSHRVRKRVPSNSGQQAGSVAAFNFQQGERNCPYVPKWHRYCLLHISVFLPLVIKSTKVTKHH